MHQAGLNCRCKPRYVHTTDSKHGEPVYPNVIKDLPIESRESVLGGGSDLYALTGRLCRAFLVCWTPTPAHVLAGAWLTRWIAAYRSKRWRRL